MSKEPENKVEIEEVSQPEPTAFATKGLLPEEIEMAKTHGLIEEEKVDDKSKERTKDDGSESSEKGSEDEHTERTESETEEDTGSEEDKETEDKDGEGEEKEVKPTFEDVEKDENSLKQYNPNEQALYWKWKADKKKRQNAQKEAEELRAKFELNQVKDSAYKIKLKKISDALRGESVTVEALQSIIGEQQTEDGSTPITKSDLERIEAEKEERQKAEERLNQQRAERIKLAEEIGKSKYNNFDDLTDLARKVVESDKSGTYKDILQAAFADDNIDEENLVERVVTLAKLHPEFGKKKSPEKSEKTDVDRAIKNSKKKISSAAVGHGGGKRTISYDDLTVEDAARLSTDQWRELPEEVRHKLLMQ